MLLKIFHSFRHAFRGMRFAYIHDKSFKIEVWATPLVVFFAWYFWPLTSTEVLFLALGVSLIYITELVNTAFERALEKIHPERHELIGKSKDIASSAVLVAVFYTALVILVILLSHFGMLP
ncbi:MAG: diacylglycerol kinase family protein [bacterium]|nr:diacylglycerol kinase family protein [bacterium]